MSKFKIISESRNGVRWHLSTCPYANMQLLYPAMQFSTIGSPATRKSSSCNHNQRWASVLWSQEGQFRVKKAELEGFLSGEKNLSNLPVWQTLQRHDRTWTSSPVVQAKKLCAHSLVSHTSHALAGQSPRCLSAEIESKPEQFSQFNY